MFMKIYNNLFMPSSAAILYFNKKSHNKNLIKIIKEKKYMNKNLTLEIKSFPKHLTLLQLVKGRYKT